MRSRPPCCRACSWARCTRRPRRSASSRASPMPPQVLLGSGVVPSQTIPIGGAPSPSADIPPPPSSRLGSAQWSLHGRRACFVPRRGQRGSSSPGPQCPAGRSRSPGCVRAGLRLRAGDGQPAIGGPLLAIGLLAAVGIRWAIALSVIPRERHRRRTLERHLTHGGLHLLGRCICNGRPVDFDESPERPHSLLAVRLRACPEHPRLLSSSTAV